MPWTPKSAKRYTKAAKTPKKKRQWSKTANAVYQKTGNAGRAVRTANSAVKKSGRKR